MNTFKTGYEMNLNKEIIFKNKKKNKRKRFSLRCILSHQVHECEEMMQCLLSSIDVVVYSHVMKNKTFHCD